MSAPVPQRVLVAGSGSIAQRHIRNLLTLGVAEVVVWTARDVSGAEPFSDSRVTVVAALPADCPHVAIVANDTDRHLATARQLVDRDVHVLVEKPLAAVLSPGLSRLCDDVRSRGLVGRVAYNLRLLGALGRVKDELDSGALGHPLFARIEVGQWLPDWRPNRPVEELYSASAARGGGVALDLSHEVDYMTMLFGQPAQWRVHCANTGALPIESADVFDAIYSFQGGFTCTVHLDYLEKPARRRLRVVGTEGVVECDIMAGELVVTGEDGVRELREPELFDVQATYIDEVSAFFSEVDGSGGEGVRLPTLEEGCNVLRLLADDTADSGRASGCDGASR